MWQWCRLRLAPFFVFSPSKLIFDLLPHPSNKNMSGNRKTLYSHDHVLFDILQNPQKQENAVSLFKFEICSKFFSSKIGTWKIRISRLFLTPNIFSWQNLKTAGYVKLGTWFFLRPLKILSHFGILEHLKKSEKSQIQRHESVENNF